MQKDFACPVVELCAKEIALYCDDGQLSQGDAHSDRQLG